MILAPFVAAAFLGAALLFLVEPMAAKALLPALGGSAAVWSVSLVFYQGLLFLGYAYAHAIGRWARRGALVHAAVLAIAIARLPFHGFVLAPGGGSPVLAVLTALGAAVGLPFFALAATGPLVQRWLAPDRDPYPLYAVGNVASLAALLAYPLLVEPRLPLAAAGGLDQGLLFSGGFILFAGCAAACALVGGRPDGELAAPPTSWRQRLGWLALAAIPSAAMLGTTQALATDVASVPLLWVLPLAVYLVSFIITFARPRLPLVPAAVALVALVLAVGAVRLVAPQPDPHVALPLLLAALLAVGLVCHGRLVRLRPPAGALTTFYLCLAAGGALGSLACGLLAPLVFRSIAEYPLSLIVACVALPRARRVPWPWLAAVAATALFAVGALRAGGHDLVATRSFFGVIRVKDGSGPRFRPATGPHAGQEMSLPTHELFHGTTLHGLQVRRPSEARLPTSYYHPSGPIGRVFATLDQRGAVGDVGVVGLGVGTLAAYAHPGQRFTFFELDPAVVRVARDPDFFSFLRDSPGQVDVVVADGRVALAAQPDGRFQLLVIDAFGSDAVPVHLLTREALALDLRKVGAHGLVAFHLSSRFFQLAPVVAAAAASLGKAGVFWHDDALTAVEAITGKRPSDWAVVAADPADLPALVATGPWTPLASYLRMTGSDLWTDRASSPLAAMRPFSGALRALAPARPRDAR